jgi:sugar phosphate permease
LLWFSGLGIDSGYWSAFFVPSVLITLGLGLSFTPLAYAATAGVPPQEAGLASGLVNTSRQIGGAVGLAALATVATSRTQAVSGVMNHFLALTDGYTLAFRISSVIALGAAAAALLVPARPASGARAAGAAGPGATTGATPSAAVAVGEPATHPAVTPAAE